MNKKRALMFLENAKKDISLAEQVIEEQISLLKESIEELQIQKESLSDTRGGIILTIEEINGS